MAQDRAKEGVRLPYVLRHFDVSYLGICAPHVWIYCVAHRAGLDFGGVVIGIPLYIALSAFMLAVMLLAWKGKACLLYTSASVQLRPQAVELLRRVARDAQKALARGSAAQFNHAPCRGGGSCMRLAIPCVGRFACVSTRRCLLYTSRCV